MYSVGIDVSKGKSTVCILAPLGEVIRSPYEITHTEPDLKELAKRVRSYGGKNDIRVVMEATGSYSLPVLHYLLDQGLFVCQVNPLAMKKYRSDINFRGVKTDRIDALSIAQYGIDKWQQLCEFQRADQTYEAMRLLSRQYLAYQRPHVLLTQNLDHVVDLVMPGIKDEFDGYDPATGIDRLSDFLEEFWHYGCITSLGPKKFEDRFRRWAKKKGYRSRADKPSRIYQIASEGIPSLACDQITKQMVQHTIEALRGLNHVLYEILAQIRELAEHRPEYQAVRAMSGVGEVMAPLLVAEVGDPRRYHSGKALVACVGIDVPPYESGQFKAKERRITRKGSKQLRKLGYLAVQGLDKIKPTKDTAVYDKLMKKRAEGKPYKLAIVAAMNKFYRIYYARAMEAYEAIGQ